MKPAVFLLLALLLEGCSNGKGGAVRAALETASTAVPTAEASNERTLLLGNAAPVATPSSDSAPTASPGDLAGAVQREGGFRLTDQLAWRAEYFFYGMFREDMVLSKTTDGGKTWTVVADGTRIGAKVPGGVHAGFEFTDEKKGWMIVNSPRNGEIGLYRTLDGGESWELQPVSKPPGWDDAIFESQPPHFINSEVGAFLAAGNSSALLCLTVNGGDTWTANDEADGKVGDVSWHIERYDNGVNVCTLTVGQEILTL